MCDGDAAGVYGGVSMPSLEQPMTVPEVAAPAEDG